jgi:hypothetical protein
MGQSYTTPMRIKQRIVWMNPKFLSSLRVSPFLQTPFSFETSPSSSQTLPLLTSPSSSETSSLSLETFPEYILSVIFRKLDVISMTAVEVTCKYFRSILESVPKLCMYIYTIVMREFAVVEWELLDSFGYSLEYIFQDQKLQFLSKFKKVVPEGETQSSTPQYPMKALLVRDDNLGKVELQSLESFVSQHSQTTILFLAENMFGSSISRIIKSLWKLHSLEYLCINNGDLDEIWAHFINQFERLKLVYFIPNELYYQEKTWEINRPKTIFIMNFVEIEPFCGNIK